MTSTATAALARVTIGVDTHKDAHVAHAVDQLGRPLGTYTMATTVAGYRGFVDWACGLGQLDTVGTEVRQEIHRPRGLPRRPRIRAQNHCPNIGASAIKRLRAPLEDRHSARRGTYRVIYRIDDERRRVTGVGVFSRADAYRQG